MTGCCARSLWFQTICLEVPALLASLAQRNIKISTLSGDHPAAVQRIAATLFILRGHDTSQLPPRGQVYPRPAGPRRTRALLRRRHERLRCARTGRHRRAHALQGLRYGGGRLHAHPPVAQWDPRRSASAMSCTAASCSTLRGRCLRTPSRSCLLRALSWTRTGVRRAGGDHERAASRADSDVAGVVLCVRWP